MSGTEMRKNKDSNTSPPVLNKLSVIMQIIISVLNLFIAIVVGFIAFRSCKATEGNNIISDTANLITIYDAMGTRTGALLAITDELEYLQLLYKTQNIDVTQNIEANMHLILLEHKQKDAIYSVLNFFEFVCQQYFEDKVDKDAFKLFYDNGALKNVLGEFKDLINDGTYPYTKNVLDEWESDDGR